MLHLAVVIQAKLTWLSERILKDKQNNAEKDPKMEQWSFVPMSVYILD